MAVDQIVSTFMENNTQGDMQSLRLREIRARETEAEARTTEAEARKQEVEARKREVDILASRARSEVEILERKSQEEQKMMRLQRISALLSERHKLKEAGVAQEDIDKMLPLED